MPQVPDRVPWLWAAAHDGRRRRPVRLAARAVLWVVTAVRALAAADHVGVTL